MKNHNVFHIISEISEVLSLSNDPQQLTQTALDTIKEVLNIECCWIQLGNTENARLPIIGFRGFTPRMEEEIKLGGLEHDLIKLVAGLGHKIIIPDLSRDEAYELSAFREVGLSSLAAVPIRTYRIHGVLGVASRVKLRLNQEFAELLTAIAGVIGMALNKAIPAWQNDTTLRKQTTPDVTLTAAAPAMGQATVKPAIPAGTDCETTAGNIPSNAENTLYSLTGFTTAKIEPPSVLDTPIIPQTEKSAGVLTEFARIWSSLPQQETAILQDATSREVSRKSQDLSPSAQWTSNSLPSATEHDTEAIPQTEIAPSQSKSKKTDDPFTEHNRRVRFFRKQHTTVQ
ncbi:MAG: GAF domain-containing protein [Dehalococcoidales bacterium]|nr:GAF domain-containing protein [Dehalococcoidales bacterium]